MRFLYLSTFKRDFRLLQCCCHHHFRSSSGFCTSTATPSCTMCVFGLKVNTPSLAHTAATASEIDTQSAAPALRLQGTTPGRCAAASAAARRLPRRRRRRSRSPPRSGATKRRQRQKRPKRRRKGSGGRRSGSDEAQSRRWGRRKGRSCWQEHAEAACGMRTCINSSMHACVPLRRGHRTTRRGRIAQLARLACCLCTWSSMYCTHTVPLLWQAFLKRTHQTRCPSIRHSEKHAACSIVPVLPDAVVLHTISCTASAGTPLAARHPGRMCRCVHALAHHSYAADVYLCAQQDGRARAVQQSISKVPGVVPVDTAKCFDAGCHHHMLLLVGLYLLYYNGA